MCRRLSFRARRVLVAAAAISLHYLPAVASAIEFNFYYTDADGTGFFDASYGAQRRLAMEEAGRRIGRLIAPTYVGEAVAVRVGSYVDASSAVLGSARPSFYYDGFAIAGTNYPKALASHLLGADVEPDHDDISMSVNFGLPFYYGAGAVPADQFDLASTVAHELVHGLGFLSSFRAGGGYGFFGDGTADAGSGQSGLAIAYDRFVNTGNTAGAAPLLSLGASARAAALAGGNLYWTGQNGTAANDGLLPKLYAPGTFVAGSVAHLDPSAHAGSMMTPGLFSGTSPAVDPVVRGILRDLGWTISVAASNVVWTAAAGTPLASNPGNWSNPTYPGHVPLPGDDLEFRNNAGNVYDVRLDVQLYSVGQIKFTAASPGYTVRLPGFTDLEFAGAGVVNLSAAAHTFVLESYLDDTSGSGAAAVVTFRNGASASDAAFQIRAGGTFIRGNPNAPSTYDRYPGAAVHFYDTATAARAAFTNQGAVGDGAPATFARVRFHGTATAGQAAFTNLPGRPGVALAAAADGTVHPINVVGWGGRTEFFESSSAGAASFDNVGQDVAFGTTGTAGLTNFADTSSAGTAALRNRPATVAGGFPGASQFLDHSSGGSAAISNETASFAGGGGHTAFTDQSTAGSAHVENAGGDGLYGGTTDFGLAADAGTATIANRGMVVGFVPGVTTFGDDSTAGGALIRNYPGNPGGRTRFTDRSSAGSATVTLEPGAGAGGQIVFKDTATAAGAHVTAPAGAGGLIDFNDASTAGNAVISLGPDGGFNLYLRFFQGATAGGATITGGAGSRIQFFNDSSAGSSDITVAATTSLGFFGGSGGARSGSAGTATIHVLGGGSVVFQNSDAARATVTVEGAALDQAAPGTASLVGNTVSADATFVLKSSALPGNAGGLLLFAGGAGAEGARVVAQSGSLLTVAGNAAFPDTPIGSIEGAGSVSLGGSLLTVGSIGTSTTFSGPITGAGGRLTKVGIGQLILAGLNDYTGVTTVAAGVLAQNGSNTGGAHVLSGATLKGTGTFAGPVDVDPGGSLEPGNTPGTLTTGPLVLADTSRLVIEVGPTPATSDHLVVNGDLTLDGVVTLLIDPLVRHDDLVIDFLRASGTVTDHGLKLGAVPAGFLASDFAFRIVGGRVWSVSNLWGDANHDGVVDGADRAAITAGFANHLAGWDNGDFNRDGRVSADDWALFSLGSALYSPGGSAFVPETGTTCALLSGLFGLAARRRKSA